MIEINLRQTQVEKYHSAARLIFCSAAAFFIFSLGCPADVISMIAPWSPWRQPMLRQSPEIKEEMAGEAVFREDEFAARSRKFPEIKLSTDQSFGRSETTDGFLSGFMLEVPLFNKTKNFLSAQISKFEREGYQIHRRELTRKRISRFLRTYYEARRLAGELAMLDEKIKIFENLIGRESQLVQEKMKFPGELDSFYRERLKTKRAIAHAQVQIESLRALMIYMAGANSGETMNLEPLDDATIIPVPDHQFERWKQKSLENQPGLLAAKLRIKTQQAKAAMARRDWMPEISAFSSYSHDPRFLGNENQIFSGIRVKWNIWDFGAGRHEARKEAATLKKMDAQLKNQESRFKLRVEKVIAEYRAAYGLWEESKNYSQFQKTFSKKQEELFEAGKISLKQMMLSRIQWLNQQIVHQEAIEEVLKRQIELTQTLGTFVPAGAGQ